MKLCILRRSRIDKCTKKRDALAFLIVLLNKPIAFFDVLVAVVLAKAL